MTVSDSQQSGSKLPLKILFARLRARLLSHYLDLALRALLPSSA
jgi:hypothetical protein